MNVPLLLLGLGILAGPAIYRRLNPPTLDNPGSMPSGSAVDNTRGQTVDATGTSVAPILDPGALVLFGNFAAVDRLDFSHPETRQLAERMSASSYSDASSGALAQTPSPIAPDDSRVKAGAVPAIELSI